MSDVRVIDQSYLPRVEKEPEPSSLDEPAAPASAFCGRCNEPIKKSANVYSVIDKPPYQKHGR